MDTQKRIQSIVGKIKKDLGDESVTLLDDKTCYKIDSISTGCYSVDFILGVGGFPRGRIVELFGIEGGGKSSVALLTIADLQKKGGIAGYIDLENSLNLEYAKSLGVDVNSMILSQPDSGDEGLAVAEKFIEEGVDLIVIDSTAAITTKAELEGEIYDQHIGQVARLLAQALKRLVLKTRKSNSVLLFINQLREKVGVLFGNPETTPGGRALKFYSSMRVQITKIKTLKDANDVAYGDTVKIKTVKNKVGPPFKECEVDMIWSKGFDETRNIVNSAVEKGIIQNPKQGTYILPSGNEIRGLEKVLNLIREDATLRSEILAKLTQEIK